ncbi:MAG: UDP-galactopyranose mutase [Lachnospiraceae bacterium]|nr:UDP-galactopyranose mutase [Lachnospiraceae bacterium]
MHYDYLITGAGLFGAVFANEMKKRGRSCVVIDRRPHIAGNIYTEKVNGIHVHRYGAHIFHTSDEEVWEYVQQFAKFNNFINSPVARYKDELYNLPFNMNTFSRMWGVRTPAEAKARIEEQVAEVRVDEPKNLEEQALNLVGRDVYEKLVKGYTEKQWGRDCTELPAFIIRRLPLRFIYDNNYFNDPHQGIPVGGYTQIVEKLLEGTPVILNTDFADAVREEGEGADAHFVMGEDTFDKVLYTGRIDEYFDRCFGPLEYRSLRFETEVLPEEDNFQGNAVVNYTEREVPFTRIIEHKFFEFGKDSETGEPIPGTVIIREYPDSWEEGKETYYPVNNEKNDAIYQRYAALAAEKKNVLFGGRLGMYRYYDMDKVIRAALDMVRSLD